MAVGVLCTPTIDQPQFFLIIATDRQFPFVSVPSFLL